MMLRTLAVLVLMAGPCLAQTATTFQTLPHGSAISSAAVDGAFGGKRDTKLMPMPQDFATTPAQAQLLGTGAIDAGPLLTAANASARAYLPCGTYQINSTVILVHGFTSAGRSCVTFRSGLATGDALLIPASASHTTLSGFKLVSATTQTSGAGLHIQGDNATISDFSTIGSTAFFNDVVQLDGANTPMLADFSIDASANGPANGSSGNGIHMVNGSVDVHLANGTIKNAADNFLMESGSGLYVDKVDSIAARHAAWRFAPSSGVYLYGIYMTNVLGDTSTAAAFSFDCGAAGCGAITQVKISNWWAGASGSTGQFGSSAGLTLASPGVLVTNPNVNGLALVSGDARANGGAGIDLRGGANITISAAHIFQNNWNNGAGLCGIALGSAVTNLIISDSIIGSGGLDATALQGNHPNYQVASICRAQPASGAAAVQIIVANSILTGNASAGTSIGKGASDVVVNSGNIGF